MLERALEVVDIVDRELKGLACLRHRGAPQPGAMPALGSESGGSHELMSGTDGHVIDSDVKQRASIDHVTSHFQTI